MERYNQYCPVAQALDLVGDRWTLLVVREVLLGSCRFNDILRGIPRLPRSTLARRLQQLETHGLVEQRRGTAGPEYVPTEAGAALEDVLVALGLWSREHAHRSLRDEEIDAGLLMWNVQRGIAADRAPTEPTMIRFELTNPQRGIERYWLKLADGVGELCLTNPGMEEALVVHASARLFTEVWLGHRGFREAIVSGDIVVEGPQRLVDGFPSWFTLNHFAQLDQTESSRASR